MKIVCLVEDTSHINLIESEHGVSFYIETKKHKILFDLGQSDLFLRNAKHLHIDLSLVDIVVISHGHYDHGGGLNAFMKINSNAKIYINKHAFEAHYSMRKENEMTYNGLDQRLIDSNRFIFVDQGLEIDEELTLFADVKGEEFYPKSNQSLFKLTNEQFQKDDFNHEQNLMIKEHDKHVLFAGCAHHGIINIIQRASEIAAPQLISTVIGGFHFVSRFPELAETEENIKKISKILLALNPMYYTGHCTGLKAYDILKQEMKNRVEYFSSGFEIVNV